MKAAPAVVGVALLLSLLTWLLLNGLNLNSDGYDRQSQALADFTQFERGMRREVLTVRAGLSRNYDALMRIADAYDDALARLREAACSDREEVAAIDVLAARAGRQEELVEQFKSKNALLQNSFAYFGLFGTRLGHTWRVRRRARRISQEKRPIFRNRTIRRFRSDVVMMQGLTASHFATECYSAHPGDVALVHPQRVVSE